MVDEILGTRLVGRAHTLGEIELELETRPNRLIATIVFSGTIDMQTRGTNGPVVLENTGQTRFQVKKRILVSGDELVVEPSVAVAETSCTTEHLESTLPGLRGRIAERIAWRRVHETQAEADAIAARHCEARLARELDNHFAQLAADGLKQVYRQISRLVAAGGSAPRLRFASTRTHLRIDVEQGPASGMPAEPTLAAAAEDCDLSARVHRSLVERALADAELRNLVPLLLSHVVPPAAQVRPVGSAAALASIKVNWSPDGNWLLVRCKAPQAPQPVSPSHVPAAGAGLPLAGTAGQ